MGLCIGGGGGGGDDGRESDCDSADLCYGGGGSGSINYAPLVNVQNDFMSIYVGKGGTAGSDGGLSRINQKVSAPGGYAGTCGNGGSGGTGGGTKNEAGGNSGSDGELFYAESLNSGKGQGVSYWSEAIAAVRSSDFVSYGSGGSSGLNTGSENIICSGGGGGGGLVVNYSDIRAQSGSNCGGEGGIGYGAGGGGACCDTTTNFRSTAGAGAPGICIIMYTMPLD